MKKGFLIFILVGLSAVVSAKNIFVNKAATGTGDGSSWQNAYTLLSSAFAECVHGDSIYLAKGDYTESASITLNKLITIKGGYAGTEDVSSQQPDYSVNKVNLRCISSAPFFKIDFPVDPNLLSDKLVIRGVTFKKTNAGSSYGSAIQANNFFNLVEITQCDFIENTTTGTGKGGAIYITNMQGNLNQKLNIYGCNFIGNSSPEGGAIDVFTGTGSSIITIDHSNFVNNKSTSGGAIYSREALTLNLKNSTFINNTASLIAGALYIYRNQTCNISDCQFLGNTTYTATPTAGTTLKASTIFSNVASTTYPVIINISKTIISNNNAMISSQRGAIEINNTQATTVNFSDSYITNNKPVGVSSYFYGRDLFVNPYNANLSNYIVKNTVINGQKIVSGTVDGNLVDKVNNNQAYKYTDYYTQVVVNVKKDTTVMTKAILFVNTTDDVNVPFVNVSSDSVSVKIVKNNQSFALSSVAGQTANLEIDIANHATYNIAVSTGYKVVDNTDKEVTILNAPGKYILILKPTDTAIKTFNEHKIYRKNNILNGVDENSLVICYNMQGVEIYRTVASQSTLTLPVFRFPTFIYIKDKNRVTVVR